MLHMNRMKDIKILRNTLNNAVELMRAGGIDAEITERSNENGQEFLIIVRN